MKSNLLFITGCYPKEFEDYFVKQSKVMPQNAANVLSWRIIEGLEENIPGRFLVLTMPFIGYYPKGFKKLVIKSKKWSHNGKDEDRLLGFINIKGLETLIKSEKIYRFVKKWYKQSQENRAILIYSHYVGFMRAIRKIRKAMPDMHISCIVTDMPELHLEVAKGIRRLKTFLREIAFKTVYENLKHINSFVLLTEEMKVPLHVDKRPYIVMEGIVESKKESKENFKANKKPRVVYTGTLHKKYGVLRLIESFSFLHDEAELYICGDGDGREEVTQMTQNSKNVFYLGLLQHKEALELQSSADILVNPRPNKGIYTAFSFPSKTMEYLAAGKPVLCYKLAGIPKEYDDYLFYYDSEEPSRMAQSIRTLIKLNREELSEIGRRNFLFAQENKTSKIQVKRILEMMWRE